jgi:hypothetical protein
VQGAGFRVKDAEEGQGCGVQSFMVKGLGFRISD